MRTKRINHLSQLHTGKVAESTDQRGLLVINNERTTALNVSTVAHLSFSSADLVAILSALDIIVCLKGLEQD